MGVQGEIVVLAMFEDKDAVGLEQFALNDEVGQGLNFLQGVGRIGKDEVELLMAGLDEAEHIAADCYHIRDSPPVIRSGRTAALSGGGGPSAELFQAVLNEAVVVAVELDADDATTATREQFEGDATRAGEEVEGLGTVEVDVLNEHVEDVLLGEVGSGPRLERARNVEMTALVFSSNDSHTSLTSSEAITSFNFFNS